MEARPLTLYQQSFEISSFIAWEETISQKAPRQEFDTIPFKNRRA